jgi:hypothetical protein
VANPGPRSKVSDLSLQPPAQIVGYRGHGGTGPQNEEGSMRRCVVKQLPAAFGSAHNWKFNRPSRTPSGLQKACSFMNRRRGRTAWRRTRRIVKGGRVSINWHTTASH